MLSHALTCFGILWRGNTHGNTQGMSYLAAFLLLHMPCDEAFISLGNLLALRYFPDFLSVSAPPRAPP
jgi:hypothetical protein